MGPTTVNWHHSQLLQCEASLAEFNTHAKGKNNIKSQAWGVVIGLWPAAAGRSSAVIYLFNVNVEASLPILSELAWQAASLQCDE